MAGRWKPARVVGQRRVGGELFAGCVIWQLEVGKAGAKMELGTESPAIRVLEGPPLPRWERDVESWRGWARWVDVSPHAGFIWELAELRAERGAAQTRRGSTTHEGRHISMLRGAFMGVVGEVAVAKLLGLPLWSWRKKSQPGDLVLRSGQEIEVKTAGMRADVWSVRKTYLPLREPVALCKLLGPSSDDPEEWRVGQVAVVALARPELCEKAWGPHPRWDTMAALGWHPEIFEHIEELVNDELGADAVKGTSGWAPHVVDFIG